jgi:hypothetical protein
LPEEPRSRNTATIRNKLPEFAKACADDANGCYFTKTLSPIAIRFDVICAEEVHIIGSNPETVDLGQTIH